MCSLLPKDLAIQSLPLKNICFPLSYISSLICIGFTPLPFFFFFFVLFRFCFLFCFSFFFFFFFFFFSFFYRCVFFFGFHVPYIFIPLCIGSIPLQTILLFPTVMYWQIYLNRAHAFAKYLIASLYKTFIYTSFPLPYTLVIITWLAYSCRNRMLRHCPTDDRIIGGKKKGEGPLFLCNFLHSVWILAVEKVYKKVDWWILSRCFERPQNVHGYHLQTNKIFSIHRRQIVVYLRCNVLFKIFSYLHAQNLMFLFINIAVFSVSPKNDVFWYNFQLPRMSQ